MRRPCSMSVESRGSMDSGIGDETIYPMEDSSRPNRRRNSWIISLFVVLNSWIISLFVVLNTVIFIVAMFINDCPKDLGDKCTLKFLGRFSFQPRKENRFFGPSSTTLEKMGALECCKVVKEHQGWRLITCIWLHAGVIHLLFNMLSLILIGILLGQKFRFVRIGIVYPVSAFGGSLLSALFNHNGVSVGASGALFGLLGVILSDFIIPNWTIYATGHLSIILSLSMLYTVAFGLRPDNYEDIFAHIGGFISGFLLEFVFLMWPQYRKNILPRYAVRSRNNVYHIIMGLLSLILLIGGFTGGLVLLFYGVNANKCCSSRRDLDWVPTSIRTFDDGVITCQEIRSNTDFILICQNGGKRKLYLFHSITEAQKRRLCCQQCS